MNNLNAKKCMEIVLRELKKLKYEGNVDYPGLLKGNQDAFIVLYRYIFCDFDKVLSKHLIHLGYEMTGMPDRKFMETAYRVCWDVIDVKPHITVAQFFSSGFAIWKMDMLCAVGKAIRELLKSLKKSSSRKAVMTCTVKKSEGIVPEVIEVNRSCTVKKSVGGRQEIVPEIIEMNRSRRTPPKNITESKPSFPILPKRNVLFSSDVTSNQNVASTGSQPTIGTCENEGHSLSNDSGASVSEKPVSSELSTSNQTDTLLETISSKLDNIVARLTILETRVSRIEEKIPGESIHHTDDILERHCRLPSYNNPKLTNNGLSTEIPKRLDAAHRDLTKQPVEAVVVDLTKQPTPVNKNVKLYDLPVHCEAKPNERGDGFCAPRQYSPTLYRLASDDLVTKDISSDEENSNVTSDNDSDDSNTLDKLPPRPPVKEKPSEFPAAQVATSGFDNEAFQAQMSRIQDMIDTTQSWLRPPSDNL